MKSTQFHETFTVQSLQTRNITWKTDYDDDDDGGSDSGSDGSNGNYNEYLQNFYYKLPIKVNNVWLELN